MPATGVPRLASRRWADTLVSADGLTALSLSVALGFSVICGAVLWQERRNAWEHAGQTTSNLVEAINADIARNIEQYALSLQGAIYGLNLPDIDQVSPRIRAAVLFDTSAGARYLGAIRILNEAGDVTEMANVSGDRQFSAPKLTNFYDRDFFQFHKNNSSEAVHISNPFIGSSGEYVIAISRRLSHPDGSFSGVVVGTLRVAYFRDLFAKVAPSPRSALTLFAVDGTVIMRQPLGKDDVGRSLTNAEVLKKFPEARSGLYEKVALIDGMRRLYAYSQVGDLPLLMVVGIPVDEVYASWTSEAFVAGLLMLALCGATIFSALLLRRELRRRVTAEQKLAVLATTDSLTGLANRRHFDEVIAKEWQRAMRERTPISVLMIDTDFFKPFNDTHGHQIGDRLLEAVAACIVGKARRAMDLPTRYGGDEFALLLPGTAGQGALEVAERIRAGVLALPLPNSNSAQPAGASVSIGVAAVVPLPGSPYTYLIEAADKALYDAKAKGRNRSELIELPRALGPDGPRLVA